MRIKTFTHLYKVVTPHVPGRMLTTWNEGDDPKNFECFEKVRLPLGTSDKDIMNTWHEIGKKRSNEIKKMADNPIDEKVEEKVEEDTQD